MHDNTIEYLNDGIGNFLGKYNFWKSNTKDGLEKTVICRKYNFIHKNSKESSGHVFSTMIECKVKILKLVMFLGARWLSG